MREGRGLALVVVSTSVLLLAGCGGGATKTVTVQPGTSSQSTPATTTPAAASTAIHIYAPYSAEGKLTVPVTKTGAGSCFTGSIISQRSDAWRCSDGNELLDPCFSAVLNAHSVVCPLEGPWSGQALELKLAKGLPSTGNSARPPLTDPAWAIELSGGERCLFLAGTSSIVADLRENYECPGSLGLYGNETRSTELWTIFGRKGSTGQLTPEPIAAIWF